MIVEANPRPATGSNSLDYETAVTNSALWAAAGDALGWMTELSRNRTNIQNRTGTQYVKQPVKWRRLIGGRNGVTIELPAGTYSDDTQLRLCVSRSIRGNGVFDVETFAKIELTVWQGYSLGAGLGSKAAALNLAKRGVNWFSNFFSDGRQRYTSGGGNGAAMRIQPHVWSARHSADQMLLNVFRDAIVTHGHPHGFGGALFHALSLWDTAVYGRLPSFEAVKEHLLQIRRISSIIQNDSELAQFWLPNWERTSGQQFESALDKFLDEAWADVDLAFEGYSYLSVDSYPQILERLGCYSENLKGSGFKTALAALMLSHIYGPESIEEAIVAAANEFRSDTDTIATMAGALLGILAKVPPSWQVQDREYIESEARRLAGIGLGYDQVGFDYPDLVEWEPPSGQSESIVLYNGNLAMIGLGSLDVAGAEYQSSGFVWQWLKLPFGQSVLAKRRANTLSIDHQSQFSGYNTIPKSTTTSENSGVVQQEFAFTDKAGRNGTQRHSANHEGGFDIDRATDLAIKSNFDNSTIGHLVNQCIDETKSIENVIGLVAIIAKAKLVRIKKMR